MSKTSPFDFIRSINEKTEIEPALLSDYMPYIVNRGLAHYEDCVLWANEANKLSNVDKDLQYMFLYGVVKKRKRYTKWVKKESEEDLEPIMQVYKVNRQRATEILKLLNNKQLQIIKEKLFKGGL